MHDLKIGDHTIVNMSDIIVEAIPYVASPRTIKLEKHFEPAKLVNIAGDEDNRRFVDAELCDPNKNLMIITGVDHVVLKYSKFAAIKRIWSIYGVASTATKIMFVSDIIDNEISDDVYIMMVLVGGLFLLGKLHNDCVPYVIARSVFAKGLEATLREINRR